MRLVQQAGPIPGRGEEETSLQPCKPDTQCKWEPTHYHNKPHNRGHKGSGAALRLTRTRELLSIAFVCLTRLLWCLFMFDCGGCFLKFNVLCMHCVQDEFPWGNKGSIQFKLSSVSKPGHPEGLSLTSGIFLQPMLLALIRI